MINLKLGEMALKRISLTLILITLIFACKDDFIRIELNEDIPGYEGILLSLFNLEVRKENPQVFLIKGVDMPQFLTIAARLPYLKSIEDRPLNPDRNTFPEKQSVFIIYEESLQPELQKNFEIFFGFRDKKYHSNLKAYSYTVSPPLDAPFVLETLRQFPFVRHAEENRVLKAF
jgi:hypothetical protein